MPDLVHFSRLRTIVLVILGVSFIVNLTIGLPALAEASSLRRSAIVRAVEHARPSVVNIHGRKTVRPGDEEITSSNSARQVNGMGTGVVIDERGYVITNYHVVEGVGRIQVTMEDGKTLIGRLIAHDPSTDLAIIKVNATESLPVIPIGTSSDLMSGEEVIAIGNAYGYEHTVTRGIISALHRPVQVSEEQKYVDLIQTDASINPGNSGGPLLNIDGDMIGINVAVRVGAQGIGFAVPIDQAIEVAAKLLDAEVSRAVTHGVSGKSIVRPTSSEYLVTSVMSGGPSDEVGLQPGDIVTDVGDKKVARSLDFHRALLGRRPGEAVELRLVRNKETHQFRMTLGEPSRAESSVADRAWTVLGVKLSPVSSRLFRRQNSRYRGGLKIEAVRPGGPAAHQGIRNGDILVGMHKWETISLENVAYILDSQEFQHAQPVKFFILRDNETLFGHMQVSLR